MATYRKTKAGTFQATVYVGRDGEGKQMRRYITRPTLKACKQAAQEMERQIREKRFTDVPNMRFTRWMDRWLELNKGRLAPSTVVSYKVYIENHFKPFWGHLKLSQVNHLHLTEFMTDKLKEYSVSYVRKMMFVLSEMLEGGMPGSNPMRNVDLPQQHKKKPHLITLQEFEMIVTHVQGSYYELIILLAGWCGLRRGEICALKWDDINWSKHTIRIDESRSITEDGTYQDKSTKSAAGLRSVAAPTMLLDKLKQHRASQRLLGGYIFDVRPDAISRRFSRMMKTLGMEGIRFHDLRHYHASWLYAQGIPDHYAAQRLGHDIHVLKGIYQHMGLDANTELDERIKNIT